MAPHRRRIFFAAVISATLLALFSSCGGRGHRAPLAQEGVLDLRGWPLSDSGTVDLDGEWEFYWRDLLFPGDFETRNPVPDLYAEVPGTWNDLEIDGERLGADGYATYRLTVLLAEDHARLAIKFQEAATAATIFVNGEKLAESGTTGTAAEDSDPAYLPQLVRFEVHEPTVDVVLHVSNFDHRSGGARRKLQIGSEAYLSQRRNQRLFTDAFVFGIILAVGLLHLGYFVARRDRTTFLFFFVICILILLRALTTSERFLLQLIPVMPWAFHYRLEYLSYYLLLPAFAYYLRSLFPVEFPRAAMRINLGISLFFATMVIVFPVRVFSRALVFFQAYTFAALIFGAIAFALALSRRREGAGPMSAGFILFVLVVVNDVLAAAGVIDSVLLTPIGLFIFIVLQAGFLTAQYSRAFDTIHRQREEISRHRDGLEKLVEERTSELESAVFAAQRASEAKSDFLAHMSHELRTPLSHIYGFAELLTDDKVGPLNDLQREYLSDILGSGKHLLGLINRVLDLTKVEAGRMELDSSEFQLADVVKESIAMLENRAQSASVEFRTSGIGELPPVHGDRMMIKQVVLNILDNALKFSPNGGIVELEGSQADGNERSVSLTISDSGIGIEKENFDRVFEPLEQLDSPRSRKYSGAGIGMALARRFIELHGGVLEVHSEGTGKGTSFCFTLPV